MQVRVVVFGMQIDNDAVYSGIATQPSPAYSSLYLSDFFLKILCIIKFSVPLIFRKDFSTTMKGRVLLGIFGIESNDFMWHLGIANQSIHANSSLYLSYFFPSFE